MEFLINLFIAGPTPFLVICFVLAISHAYFKVYPVKPEDTTKYYVARNIKYWFGIFIILYIAMALISPINTPKNRVKTLNEVSPISAEIVVGDADKASQPVADRVPKPKQREVFVHDLKKDKNAE